MMRAPTNRRRSIKGPPACQYGRSRLQRPLNCVTLERPAGAPYTIQRSKPASQYRDTRGGGSSSQIVGALAVRGDVESFALLILRDSQTDEQLHDQEGDES